MKPNKFKVIPQQMEQALLTKKQLNIQACPSCQRNLINLEGKPQFQNTWNRFPFRPLNAKLRK